MNAANVVDPIQGDKAKIKLISTAAPWTKIAGVDSTQDKHMLSRITSLWSAWTRSKSITSATIWSFNNAERSPTKSPMTVQPGTTVIYSVWDGDWAILEEYDQTGARVQGFVQGYHGLVKTLVGNSIYYYQDELGSTSHIADSNGALIESYQYGVYGKPQVYSPGGALQQGATPIAKDLFTGQRWIPEIGLYDDRNRFMSPDIGRFLQPDPIGFKGDASNLYRYCGNDWANRTDPMGTDSTEKTIANTKEQQEQRETFNDHERGALMSQMMNVQRINFRTQQELNMGFTMKGTTAKPDPSFKVDAKPITVGAGVDPKGASGSVFTIQFKTDLKGYEKFEPQQEISYGFSENGQMVWHPFEPDTKHPMQVGSKKDGFVARDQAGKWESGHPPGSATRSDVAVSNFRPFGEKMRTSAIGIKHDGSRDVIATHPWGATYQEGRAPQYEGTGRWYDY